MNFIMTNDVECYSFQTNSYDYKNVHERIYNEALPKLLKLFEKYNVKSTFFFTGKFARLCPEAVKLVNDEGHEVGCHGYRHEDKYNFDKLSFNDQVKYLNKSKKIIEGIIDKKIISFRAPALRINNHLPRSLKKTGFKIDSSIASQRFDGPMTSGALKKLKWMVSPRKPYHMSRKNPYKKGTSKIFEVPISAFLWSYVGTYLRLSPSITNIIQKLLVFESKFTKKPLVFLFHPNECLDFVKKKTVKRGNFLTDEIRHKIKMRNLGTKSLVHLEKIFNSLKNTKFITMREYYESQKN
jgi:peptidoglycan-N-acetylglucosamine deacetylase